MAVNLSLFAGAGAQFFNNSGVILSGGLVYTYAAGTTTPQTTYTTSAGNVAHANPIVLDSAGRVPSGGEIWLTDAVAYKFVLQTSTAVLIATYDNVTGNASGIYAAFAASSGSSLVGYIQSGTGAVATTVQARLRQMVTVEDFGAVGDGVTNDSAAFNAMIAATNGTIRVLAKEYNVQYLNYTTYDKIVIQGTAQPLIKSDLSKLENGSILIGQIYVEANNVYFENFGIDSGSARTVASRGGLWANAKPSQIGNIAVIKNITALNESDAGVWHGITAQGYNYNEITDIYVARQQFGIVMKGRNALISNVTAIECRTASVYPKSDTPVFSGNVADATVINVEIDNVISLPKSTNTDCAGVYCHASSDVISKILINNVYQGYGYSAVRIQGGGLISDPTISSINVSNVNADKSQYGVACGGFIYDVELTNILATNPTTGKTVIMGGDSSGWICSNIHTTISDVLITSITCMEVYGFGSFDNITVRNPYRSMRVLVQATQLGQISCGQVGYGCYIETEGSLTGLNGATLVAANPATLKILPRSFVQLTGKFDVSASTNKAFCNLPILTGKQMIFACAGIDSTNAYVAVTVRLNDFQLSIEPSIPAGFKEVDLSGVKFPLI